MKPRMYILAIASLLAVGGVAQAGIQGSDHDFSNKSWSGGSICEPCHATHSGPNANSLGLLWNHQVPTYANYTLFEGATSNDGNAGLDRDSHLCMSCHDGSVALDSFGATTNGTVFIGSSKQIGNGVGNLSDDHPVGAIGVYDFADADFVADPVANGVKLRDLTVSGQAEKVVSCASCHSVHNKSNLPELLRVTNSGSQLCLSCHNK
jgi:predicted CXXCH cytochrome family protein